MSLFLAIVSKSILYGQFSVSSFVYYRAVSNRYICHIWYTVIRTVYIPWNHMFVSDEKMHEIFTLCTRYSTVRALFVRPTVQMGNRKHDKNKMHENLVGRWQSTVCYFFIINSNVLLFTLVSLSLQLFLVLSVSYISLTPPQDCSIINKNMLGP